MTGDTGSKPAGPRFTRPLRIALIVAVGAIVAAPLALTQIGLRPGGFLERRLQRQFRDRQTELLSSADAAQRADACRLLANARRLHREPLPPETVERIRALLDDGDARVRSSALYALDEMDAGGASLASTAVQRALFGPEPGDRLSGIFVAARRRDRLGDADRAKVLANIEAAALAVQDVLRADLLSILPREDAHAAWRRFAASSRTDLRTVAWQVGTDTRHGDAIAPADACLAALMAAAPAVLGSADSLEMLEWLRAFRHPRPWERAPDQWAIATDVALAAARRFPADPAAEAGLNVFAAARRAGAAAEPSAEELLAVRSTPWSLFALDEMVRREPLDDATRAAIATAAEDPDPVVARHAAALVARGPAAASAR